MLTPRRVKHRKQQKGTVSGVSKGALQLDFGQFGLKALENRWITARQLEAARRAMTRFVARSGKIWIRVFPDKPITKKGAEVPMGGRKGAVQTTKTPSRFGCTLWQVLALFLVQFVVSNPTAWATASGSKSDDQREETSLLFG